MLGFYKNSIKNSKSFKLPLALFLIFLVIGVAFKLFIVLAIKGDIFSGVDPFIGVVILIGLALLAVVALVIGLVFVIGKSSYTLFKKSISQPEKNQGQLSTGRLSPLAEQIITGAILTFALIFLYNYLGLIVSHGAAWWENLILLIIVASLIRISHKRRAMGCPK